MCLPTGGGENKKPEPQAPAPAPKPDPAGEDPAGLVEKTKQTIKKRMGIFGNVKTSLLGDADYGMFARFGR